MVLSCCVPGCCNNSLKADCLKKKITFFHFPHHDKKLMYQWLAPIKSRNFFPTKSSRICSEHFEEHCFVYRNLSNRLFLTKDSVPTLFPTCLPSKEDSSSVDIGHAETNHIRPVENEEEILSQMDIEIDVSGSDKPAETVTAFPEVKVKQEPVDDYGPEISSPPVSATSTTVQTVVKQSPQYSSKRPQCIKVYSRTALPKNSVLNSPSAVLPCTNNAVRATLPSIVSVNSLANTQPTSSLHSLNNKNKISPLSHPVIRFQPTLTLQPGALNPDSRVLQFAYITALPPVKESEVKNSKLLKPNACEELNVEPRLEDLEAIAMNGSENRMDISRSVEDESYILPDVKQKQEAPIFGHQSKRKLQENAGVSKMIKKESEVFLEKKENDSSIEASCKNEAESLVEDQLKTQSFTEVPVSRSIAANIYRINCFKESDMESPMKSKQYFSLSKQVISAQDVVINNLRRTLARVKFTIDVLKSEDLISEEAVQRLEEFRDAIFSSRMRTYERKAKHDKASPDKVENNHKSVCSMDFFKFMIVMRPLI